MSNVFSIKGARAQDARSLVGARGYMPVYHAEEVNRCPGCGRSHWLIGRLLAECAFCATALPLSEGGMTGAGLFRLHHKAAKARGEDQLAA
jgi:hypothetical protein